MPNWNEFAWAAFLYGSIGGDRQYQALMANATFLQTLRTNPNALTNADVQSYLLKGYLNAWKTRVTNSPQSASAIKASIQNMLPALTALSQFSIKNVAFNQNINVNGLVQSVAQTIESCYQIMRASGFKIGPTATSKILHVLLPDLFVMWDSPILTHFSGINGIGDSPHGYRSYLQQMKLDAASVLNSFNNSILNPPAAANSTPEGYLSLHMAYTPQKTMAKFLDEYYWVTVTNGVVVPPKWHP